MSKTTFAKEAEAPKVGPYRFNHYNVDPVFCEGRLTAYSMGRVLQRLEWHHQQWIVLLAELSGNHELPVDFDAYRPPDVPIELDAMRPAEPTAPKTTKKAATKKDRQVVPRADKKAAISEQNEFAPVAARGDEPEARQQAAIEAGRRQSALKLVTDKINWECGAQRSWAKFTAQQLQALYGCLPTGAIAAMERQASELLEGLFEVYVEDFFPESQELSVSLRLREADERVNSFREQGLFSMLNNSTFALCDQLADRLRKELKEEDFRYFRLGRCLESALCPRDIYKLMATTVPNRLADGNQEDWRRLPERIAHAAGFVIGYHTFAPGALKVEAGCRQEIKKALARAGSLTDSLEKVLAGLGSSAVRSSQAQQQESAFTCRYPAKPDLLTTVEKIHDHIAAQLGCSAPNNKEEIEGAFGECLQILSRNKAVLRVGGRDDFVIRGSKRVPLLKKLVSSMGRVCTHADLNGAEEWHVAKSSSKPYQNLYAIVDELKPEVEKAGFTIESQHGTGYMWKPSAAQPPAKQTSADA